LENSISRLDGYTISSVASFARNPGRVYEAPGGQIWSVVSNGLIELKGTLWFTHPVEEIQNFWRAGDALRSPPLCPMNGGVVVFLLPDRLAQYGPEIPGQFHTQD